MSTKHWQVHLIQLLAVLGLLIAFYLWLYHKGVLIAACSGSGWDDCGRVSGPGAPFAAIGPVPVALIGLWGYVLIFLLTWLKDWLPGLTRYLPELLVGMSGMAFLFSLVLTGLELFTIQAICRYCVGSAVIVTLMFVLSVSYLRQTNRDWKMETNASSSA
jgi:uncharacterized membrane protein